MSSTSALPSAVAAGDIDLIVSLLDWPISDEQKSADRSRIALSHGCHKAVTSKMDETHVKAFEAILRHPNIDVNERIKSKGKERHIVVSIIYACQSPRLIDVLAQRVDLRLPAGVELVTKMKKLLNPTKKDKEGALVQTIMCLCRLVEHPSFDPDLIEAYMLRQVQVVLKEPTTMELAMARSPALLVNRMCAVDIVDVADAAMGRPLAPFLAMREYRMLSLPMIYLIRASFQPSYTSVLRALLGRDDVELANVNVPTIVFGDGSDLTAKLLLKQEEYDLHIHTSY